MIEAMSTAAISREWVGRFADGRFRSFDGSAGLNPAVCFSLISQTTGT